MKRSYSESVHPALGDYVAEFVGSRVTNTWVVVDVLFSESVLKVKAVDPETFHLFLDSTPGFIPTASVKRVG